MRKRNAYPQIGFTVKQVAAMLGLSQEAVRRQVREGNLRAGRLGTRYLVPKSEIDRIVGATAPARTLPQPLLVRGSGQPISFSPILARSSRFVITSWLESD